MALCIFNKTHHVKAFSMNGQGRKGGRPIHRGGQSITPGTSNIGLWKQTVPEQAEQVQGKIFGVTSRGGGGVTMVWVTD